MPTTQALAPEEKLSYKEGGPNAEARFEAGVAGFEARAFRGCGIFTSEPFEVSDDADSVQMLTRSSQIGEFYVMSPPQVPPPEGGMAHCCDIVIFDEESDRHVRVTWADALAACCIEGADGLTDGSEGIPKTTPMSQKTKLMSDNTLEQWHAKAKWWADNTRAGSKADYSGGDPDIRIIVARPFIEHLMHNVIMTVSGRDTGATRAMSRRSNRASPHAPRTHPARTPLTRAALRLRSLRPRGHATLGQHTGQDD